jgi:hypothetical protein
MSELCFRVLLAPFFRQKAITLWAELICLHSYVHGLSQFQVGYSVRNGAVPEYS